MTTSVNFAVRYLHAGKKLVIERRYASGAVEVVGTLIDSKTHEDFTLWDGADLIVREVEGETEPANDA